MNTKTVSIPGTHQGLYLTDSGLETTLIFHEGMDLPCFASFALLRQESGRETLIRYFERHARIAISRGLGFILDSPTWRASTDWGAKLGFSPADLADINRDAIAMLKGVRDGFGKAGKACLISGNLGPRGDGYNPDRHQTVEEAEAYHSAQIDAFAEAGVDMLHALTMTHIEEAIGIARAAKRHNLPTALSFTVETDGRLPSGQPLGEAIQATDAATGDYPCYYLINCAHPDHFNTVLTGDDAWLARIGGVRANASRLSHAELDEATELDDGNPTEFGRQYRDLHDLLPNLRVLGGCCGTDHRHIEAIADHLKAA